MDKVDESVATLLTQCCSGEDEAVDANKELDSALQIFKWEEFENSLARLCGLATVLSKARAKKESAAQKLESHVREKLRDLEPLDRLEILQKKVETKRDFLEDCTSSLNEKSRELKLAKQKLTTSESSLLIAARTLSAAQSRLQEAERLLGGEAGYGRLLALKNLLTARRRHMVAQVAALYPLIPCTNTKKCPPLAHTGEGADCTPLTISGLHVIAPVKKEATLFTDKREYETSATALGYVVHAVSLLAQFLDIRLRYSVRYGASRSFVQDFLPPCEPSSSSSSSGGGAVFLPSRPDRVVEFPLFSDGQEPTRAAYAVFLLNKDLEQILHHLNVTSAGPKHILPNLKRILRAVFRSGQSLA